MQAAHCGVAVLGKEGTQAALASDFTIADFQSLPRLLLVHGRYSCVFAVFPAVKIVTFGQVRAFGLHCTVQLL